MEGQKEAPKKPIEILLDQVEWKAIPIASKPLPGDTPYATHEGILALGDQFPPLKVYQLNTGERVIDADDVQKFFAGA